MATYRPVPGGDKGDAPLFFHGRRRTVMKKGGIPFPTIHYHLQHRREGTGGDRWSARAGPSARWHRPCFRRWSSPGVSRHRQPHVPGVGRGRHRPARQAGLRIGRYHAGWYGYRDFRPIEIRYGKIRGLACGTAEPATMGATSMNPMTARLAQLSARLKE